MWQVIRVVRFEVHNRDGGAAVVDARTGEAKQWVSETEARKAVDDLNMGDNGDD